MFTANEFSLVTVVQQRYGGGGKTGAHKAESQALANSECPCELHF